jgi:hypothetical protein
MRRHFGGDPHLIGRALTLRGKSRNVIGIMLPGFQQRGQHPAASVIANAFLRQEILFGVLYSCWR